MRRLIIFFGSINIIIILALFLWPLRAIDVSQLEGMPPFKKHAPYKRMVTTAYKKVLSQTFMPKADNISGIALFFSVPKESVKGDILLSLKKEDDSLFKRRIKINEIKSGLNVFYFKPVNLKRKTYKIQVATNSLNRHSFFVWGTRRDLYEDGSLYVNNRQQDADMVFQTYYQTSFFNMLTKKISPNPPLLSLLWTVPLFEILFLTIAFLLDRILKISNQ